MIKINSKLGVWEQQVEFESIPFSCFHCKKVGHWVKKCMLKPLVPPKKNIAAPKESKFWKEVGQRPDANLDKIFVELVEGESIKGVVFEAISPRVVASSVVEEFPVVEVRVMDFSNRKLEWK